MVNGPNVVWSVLAAYRYAALRPAYLRGACRRFPADRFSTSQRLRLVRGEEESNKGSLPYRF